MLTVPQALAAVLAHARRLPPRTVPARQALGLRLTADVRADLDLPPFDKSLVDGFAIRSADARVAGPVSLRVVETIYAGQTPSRALGPGESAEIMTGAPLPEGADAVVMVEKVERPAPGQVTFEGTIIPGQNRVLRGNEIRKGEVVVGAARVLNPVRLGVLASVGAATVEVGPKPKAWVVSTGDELVEHDRVPGPGQIRNSNSLLLTTLLVGFGADVESGPIVPDRPERLREEFRRALEFADILLVSGGVSAGQKDLVPDAFAAVGVRPVFHKVRVKPGKPLWFGVGPDRDGRPPALVFGLPGNPVSGLVSALLFVRPALAVLAGSEPLPQPSYPLAVPYRHSDDRDVYRPARLVEGGTKVEPITWTGSSDLRRAAEGDGFAVFPAGERSYEPGDVVGFLPLNGGAGIPWC